MTKKDHIVFGAFLHDIGKLFERAELLKDYIKDDLKLQEYCPDNKGYYSHRHALYTLAFCEKLQNLIPALKHQYTPDADQNWVNMAARHHKPSSVLEHIISKADRLASGEREGAGIYEKDIHKKTLLEPLLEKVSLKGNKKSTQYRIPLTPLNTHFTGLFPKKYNQLGLSGEDLLSSEKLTTDYQNLAEGLLKAIEVFSSGASDKKTVNLRGIFLTLLSQFERFLIHVPSATHVKSPDISLFDHLRVTAAIAEGLFIHHEENDTLQKNQVDILNDKTEEKWTLLCGDFSGIQKFIYSIISKGAAKSLAGRSVYVQLFCDTVSEWLLRELNLYPTSRIYSSGGRFYLLVARCLVSKMEKNIARLNQKLLAEYQGKIHLDYGVSHLCEEDFYSQKMDNKFKEVNEALLKVRGQRFYELIKTSPQSFFEPKSCSNKVCSVCGSDASYAEAGTSIQEESSYEDEADKQGEPSGDYKCRQCKKFIKTGQDLRQLAQTSFSDTTGESFDALSEGIEKPHPSGILWVWNHSDYNEIKRKHPHLNFFTLLNKTSEDNPANCVKFCIIHNQKDLRGLKNVKITDSHFEFVNCIEEPLSVNGLSFGYRFMAVCDELDFDTMIKHTKGIKRLGILRMDVDNLGQIFIKGLHYGKGGEQERQGSLSRKASLSRQLNAFFTGYLPQWAKKDFAECKIIYAGGDDLLVIGPWHQVPDMAFQIQKKFKEFCCHNPDLTLSAGVSLITEKYPVLSGVLKAGEAEEQAKFFDRSYYVFSRKVFSKRDHTPATVEQQAGTQPVDAGGFSTEHIIPRPEQLKNAFCFLDTVIGWEEYEKVKDFKALIKGLMCKTGSKQILQVLYHIDQEVKQTQDSNKRAYFVRSDAQQGSKKYEDIYYQPWRYRFVYYIARLLERHKNKPNHVKQKDDPKNNVTSHPEKAINIKNTSENEGIRYDIQKLKSIILGDSREGIPSQFKLYKVEKEQSDELLKGYSSDSVFEREFHRSPVHWLYMPVRWEDYLQREKNKKAKQAA